MKTDGKPDLAWATACQPLILSPHSILEKKKLKSQKMHLGYGLC